MANAGLVYSSLDEIDGQDPNINPMMAPTGDPDAQGGERLDLVLGLSDTIGGKHTFSVDYSLPIYQDLNGPQLETDYIFSISYKFMTM
jgi:hypothetical protein